MSKVASGLRARAPPLPPPPPPPQPPVDRGEDPAAGEQSPEGHSFHDGYAHSPNFHAAQPVGSAGIENLHSERSSEAREEEEGGGEEEDMAMEALEEDPDLEDTAVQAGIPFPELLLDGDEAPAQSGSSLWVGAIWYLDHVDGQPTGIANCRTKHKVRTLGAAGFAQTLTMPVVMDGDARSATQMQDAELLHQKLCARAACTHVAYGPYDCSFGNNKFWRLYCHTGKDEVLWGSTKRLPQSNLMFVFHAATHPSV